MIREYVTNQNCHDLLSFLRLVPINSVVRPAGFKSSRCSLCINKLSLVRMRGELGTRIEDDTLGNSRLISDRNRPYISATVYEGSTYPLHVQLDCGGQFDSPCSSSLSVQAWIDFNDNDYDDGESRILRRGWSDNSAPTGAYDLDTFIDGRTTIEGPHRLRVTVRPSDEYQRECGTFPYQESHDYTINVIRRVISKCFCVC